MKLKSILAAVAAGVALASPLAAKAYEYNDGTYKWGFYTDENKNKEQVATLYSVSRVDGQKISGAFAFPATVSLTVTNELGYSKWDEATEKDNWVQTRPQKIETLTLPVEEINWEEGGFFYEEDYWQSDPLITSVTIPEGVKYVYGLVGTCLTNVTAVTFPSTVMFVSDCFGFCDKLASVSIPEDASIDSAFIGTAWAKAMGDFFVWNGNLIRYQGTATEVVVPEGVATLGTAAFAPYYWEGFTEESWEMFASATNITSVLLPSTLEVIGNSAFNGCKKLAAIDIPNGVYAIGSSAFRYTALTAIALPKSIRELGSSAFAYTAISSLAIPEGPLSLSSTCANMTNLTAVTLPSTARSLSSTFSGCKNLTSVTIPSRAEYLYYTFSGCSKLTAIDIPAKVEEIGYGTFQGCKALTSVTGGAGLKSVNSSAFGYESTYWDSEKGQYVSSGTGVPFYDNAADGFRVLGPVAYGFKGKCPETLTTPAGVKYVMSSVIPYNSDKSAVKTITLSDGVETVGYSAFSYCANLETVNLGNTVTNLGGSAFTQSGRYEYDEELGYSVYKPGKLATVTGGAALEVGRDAFYDTQFMYDTAMLAGNDEPFGLVRLGKSVLGYKGKFAAGEFNIPADVTEFGLYGWEDSTTNVTALTGGASLKGSLGLYDFEKLQRVDVEGAVNEFGCYEMSALTDVNLPNAKLWGLYGEQFNGCTNLANITVGLNPELAMWGEASISGDAFMGCDKLQSVNVLCPGYKLTGYKAYTGFEDEDFPNDIQTFKYIGYRYGFSVYADGDVDWESLYLRPQFVKVMVDESSLEPFDSSVKSDYVGILYDAEGKFAGTFEASVKKASKTKDASATFKFTPVGGKKVTLKGTIDANGKGQGDLAGLTFGANGVIGKLTYTDKKGVTTVYEVSGSDNIAKSKDKADKDFLKMLKGKAWGISGRAFDNVTESDFANGNVAMSIVMGSSGKAKVSGVLPNGTKVSQNVQLIVGANAMAIPLSLTKGKESFGFVLWLNEKAGASSVEGTKWIGKGASAKDLFVAEFGDDAHGNALVEKTGLPDPTFMLSAGELPKGLILTADALELLPRYEGFALKGGKADKWDFLKAPKVKFDKNGVLDVEALEKDIAAGKTNVSGLKLKLTKKSGEFKGSFNVWAQDKKGKIKKQAVTVNGVMIDGIGYGSGFIKKVGAMPVQIGNENLRFVEED